MKNLKPFSGDAKKEYKDAVTRKPKDSESSRRLGSIETAIETAYDLYKQKFELNSLHTVMAGAWSSELKEDLKNMYGYKNKVIRNIRSNISNQQIVTIQSTCQYCTINSVNTMDHVLPQEKFPEYAVNGYNLFPCCTMCNDYKSDIVGDSAFLNLFIDELPSIQYLFVEVYFDIDSVNFYFLLSNKEDLIPIELYAKIENHYAKLHLLDRMKDASRSYLSEFISSIKYNYKRQGKDFVIEAALESIEDDRIAFGYNYWKCCLKIALIESDIFWNYMDEICK